MVFKITEKCPRYIICMGAGLVLFWTVVIVGSLLWNLYSEREQCRRLALNEAMAAFEKDVIYRMWNASHGGVYVPVTDETPPNPNLAHIQERDITTPGGQRLTLMNPAYMTRQVQALDFKRYGFP